MNTKRYLTIHILSLIVSSILFAVNYVPIAFIRNGSLTPLSSIFLMEIAMLIIFIVLSFIPKGVNKVGNVFLLIYTALSALILLVMTSWVKPEGFEYYLYIILLSTFGGGLVAKVFFIIFWHVHFIETKEVRFLARRNYEIISASFIAYIILIIGASIFVNEDIKLYVYIGEVVFFGGTALIALFSAIYAYSPVPLSKDKSIVQNGKDLLASLKEKNVFFYIGVIFTFILGIIAMNGANTSTGDTRASYIALATFYFAMAIIRVVTFWIHRFNKYKFEEKSPKAYYRLEHVSMLIVAIVLIILSNSFAGALALIIRNKETSETPIWWFMVYIVPFALFKLISAIRLKWKARKFNHNPYLIILSTQNLITAMYSVLGATALLHALFDNDVTLTIHIVLQGIAMASQFILVIEMIIRAAIGIIGKGKNAYIVDPE